VVATRERSSRGYYSLLRWRNDSARDEARNVGVIVVDEHGVVSGFRPAPISSISSRLHEQGILDAALQGLSDQVNGPAPFTLERLTALQEQLRSSLYLTPPKSVALHDEPGEALTALYRALVAPRGGGSSRQTKSVVLDKVVNTLRRQGFEVKRGSYVGDFIFDAVVTEQDKTGVLEVLSFAAPRKDWAPVERDAGHFLFALDELKLHGLAVIAPPRESGESLAAEHFHKVERWFDRHNVPVRSPDEMAADPTALAVLAGQ
jgi:hypothetical protein